MIYNSKLVQNQSLYCLNCVSVAFGLTHEYLIEFVFELLL